MNTKRAAIYARVSTFEQTPKNQLRDLTAYARRRRVRLVYELVDNGSGAKEDRKNLIRLMDLARERVRSGLDRARAEGKRLGRPPLDREIVAQIQALRRRGLSVRAIAARTEQSRSVVAN